MLGSVNTRSSLPAAPSRGRSAFAADRLARIAELEGSHFWFAGRRVLVERLLDRHVERRDGTAVDVGCGTGSFLHVLERYADRAIGIDPLASLRDDRFLVGQAERLPFDAGSVDLVV